MKRIFYKTNPEVGVSLIVLVITIIVMIILSGTVILSLSGSNVIDKATTSTYSQKIKSSMEAFELLKADKLIKDNSMGNITQEELIAYGIDVNLFEVIDGELAIKSTAPEEYIRIARNMGMGCRVDYSETSGVNTPVMSNGMIPVRWNGTDWVKADNTNTNASNKWYDYSSEVKQWANAVTVKSNRSQYLSAPLGTTIDQDDITAMFVWIPRYAYSVKEGFYRTSDTYSGMEENLALNQKFDIKFLVGTTNSSIEEVEGARTYITHSKDYDATDIQIGEETPMIVHPAFTFGNTELEGIWVAKFEASGSTDTPSNMGSFPGNMASDGEVLPSVSESTYVKTVPSVPSWRSISFGNAQYQCMKMKSNDAIYGLTDSDTHLIKNVEWGAVAYLSASKYGKIPQINSKLSRASDYHYDLLTGYQGNNSYENGVTASTTHNIYGIYDMNGGAYEYVAAYLDNNNKYLTRNGNSTLNTSVKYFTNNSLNEGYENYFDRYDVSEEERTNQIVVSDLGNGETSVAQGTLSYATITIDGENINTMDWNVARKRISTATYDNMKVHKGDAMYETAGSYSFYGIYRSGATSYSKSWYTDLSQPSNDETSTSGRIYGLSYNSDNVLIGYGNTPFILRGGYCSDGNDSGMFHSYMASGSVYYKYGFRPVVTLLS